MKPTALLFVILLAVSCTSTLSTDSPANSKYKAIYLVNRDGVLLANDLHNHPEVVVTNSFDELKSYCQTKVAIWIDKNAVDLVDGGWLLEEPQRYYPIVLVGYNDSVYSYTDVIGLSIAVGFQGPPMDYFQTTKVPSSKEPGFSVWLLLEDSDSSKTVYSPDYKLVPTVQDILDIRNPILEGKLPQ